MPDEMYMHAMGVKVKKKIILVVAFVSHAIGQLKSLCAAPWSQVKTESFSVFLFSYIYILKKRSIRNMKSGLLLACVTRSNYLLASRSDSGPASGYTCCVGVYTIQCLVKPLIENHNKMPWKLGITFNLSVLLRVWRLRQV
jgi:hypothetical protein